MIKKLLNPILIKKYGESYSYEENPLHHATKENYIPNIEETWMMSSGQLGHCSLFQYLDRNYVKYYYISLPTFFYLIIIKKRI